MLNYVSKKRWRSSCQYEVCDHNVDQSHGWHQPLTSTAVPCHCRPTRITVRRLSAICSPNPQAAHPRRVQIISAIFYLCYAMWSAVLCCMFRHRLRLSVCLSIYLQGRWEQFKSGGPRPSREREHIRGSGAKPPVGTRTEPLVRGPWHRSVFVTVHLHYIVPFFWVTFALILFFWCIQ